MTETVTRPEILPVNLAVAEGREPFHEIGWSHD